MQKKNRTKGKCWKACRKKKAKIPKNNKKQRQNPAAFRENGRILSLLKK
jgi:hypothetical protein